MRLALLMAAVLCGALLLVSNRESRGTGPRPASGRPSPAPAAESAWESTATPMAEDPRGGLSHEAP